MFKSNFPKKALIMVVSLILLVSTLLVACNPTSQTFTDYPELPAKSEVSSNGGVAVEYGDYIYYVNGYVSSYTGSNKYEGDVALGNIVRISKADLDAIVAINDEDTTTSQKTEKNQPADLRKSATGCSQGSLLRQYHGHYGYRHIYFR